MSKRLFLLAAILLASACRRAEPLPVLGTVPSFTLTDSTGQPFQSDTALKGRVWVADFIFTNCPGPCPRITSRLREVQDLTASSLPDVRFVSYTIDPARDTPEVLARYARAFHATPGRWYFLTGTQADLHRLIRNAFMVGNVDGSLEHSTRFALVDRQSHIRGYYDSSDLESLSKLRSDLAQLAKENV